LNPPASTIEPDFGSLPARPSNALADSTPDELGDRGLNPTPLSHKLVMGTAVVLPFVGLVTAMVLLWTVGWMGWLYVGLLIGGWILTGLGITVGFHRLLTHRSFETYGWVRALWMALGALSVEGSPLIWCAVHRRHHEHSDNPGDPHSPRLHGSGWWNSLRGLAHAHCGWLFTSFWTEPQLQRYVPDLLEEPLLVKVDRLYYLWVLASLAIPAGIGYAATLTWQGAALGFLWGGLVRIFMTHHITWSINSICHVWGRRTYRTSDHSTNNSLCGVLGLGEGWHNNHHAFPTSARHGLAWWQFDLSWLVIRGMELAGLAWEVRVPSERAKAARLI
jgi:stearoyl-CoA desaturase (delta-9 desaturase)